MAPRYRRVLTGGRSARGRRRPAPVALPARSPLSLRRVLHDWLCAWGVRTDPGGWVLPERVLACAYPRRDRALAALAATRIELIVNLHPRAHAPAALARHGIREVHLPMRDFSAPTYAVLRRGVLVVERAISEGRRVAVHCGSGRGRTGTLLACLLIARGEAPWEAITRVRRLRPGAVETRAQEIAVQHFAWQLADG